MREQIEQRLAMLRQEHEADVAMLADLDIRRDELQQTLMQLLGAEDTTRQEHDAGAARLRDVEYQRADLQETLLRADGATQVLRELLDLGEGAEEDTATEAGSPEEGSAQTRERVEQQLTELRREHEAGVTMLADLATRRDELQQTMLRIDGASRVLWKLLHPDEGAEEDTAAEAGTLEE